LKEDYIFTSERLGFRNWSGKDLTEFSKLNADLEVMEHFPKPLTEKETADFIDRLKKHYADNGFNYFATEVLDSGEFIGFIGLAFKDFKTEFTPAVDIGWRLKKSSWGNGYATEGASRCLEFGFNQLNLEKIIATCTEKNVKSENVMKKIGMGKIGNFKHPLLEEYPEYQKCICYAVTKETWQRRTD
jgi:RimJ/RimL family protein N-acetyltransferase